jgi:hypothetical protein
MWMKIPYISVSASKPMNIKGTKTVTGKASGHKKTCYTVVSVLCDGYRAVPYANIKKLNFHAKIKSMSMLETRKSMKK